MPKNKEEKAKLKSAIRTATPGSRQNKMKAATKKAAKKGVPGAAGSYKDLFNQSISTAKKEAATRLGKSVKKVVKKDKKRGR